MATRFWARYKASPLLAELGGKTAYFIKAVAAIYIVRENLVEFTVVRAAVGCGRPCSVSTLPAAPPAPVGACRCRWHSSAAHQPPASRQPAPCPAPFPPQCVGPSMMPTFNPRGDIALLEHVTVWSGRVEVGDVVLARSAQNPRHMVCKRVLGLEGDSGE